MNALVGDILGFASESETGVTGKDGEISGIRDKTGMILAETGTITAGTETLATEIGSLTTGLTGTLVIAGGAAV